MSKTSLPKTSELFSSRETLEEALTYANELILTEVPVGPARLAALTALHVTSNTAIKLLSKYESTPPAPNTKGSEMTFGEHMYLLQRALPALGKLAFQLKEVYPAASDILGLVTAALMVMTDTSPAEVAERIMQGGR